MEAAEKRMYPRLCLTLQDGYFGHFILPNQERLIASIVNMSAGGINLSMSENSKDGIQEGDILLLRNIVGGANLSFISEIKGEVRWIKQLDSGSLSVGCRFVALADDQIQQLIRFVHTERMARGQYN